MSHPALVAIERAQSSRLKIRRALSAFWLASPKEGSCLSLKLLVLLVIHVLRNSLLRGEFHIAIPDFPSHISVV